MTKENLKIAQFEIEKKMFQCAEKNNLITPEIEPIPDGICDAEKYLSTTPRLLWILKEPCDDFTNEGKPCGGGWSLYTSYDNDDAWKNPTLQPMIYTSYGIINKQRWEDMSWIRDDKSMVDILKSIAYINVNKMPSLRVSNDNKLFNDYKIWRSIILEQIDLYAPDIIIFGNTFKFLKADLVGIDAEPMKRIEGVVDIYEKGSVKLFDAWHPVQRIKGISRELYVNSIIDNCL